MKNCAGAKFVELQTLFFTVNFTVFKKTVLFTFTIYSHFYYRKNGIFYSVALFVLLLHLVQSLLNQILYYSLQLQIQSSFHSPIFKDLNFVVLGYSRHEMALVAFLGCIKSSWRRSDFFTVIFAKNSVLFNLHRLPR